MYSVAAAFLAAAALFCAAPAALACTARHFYNNSAATFIVQLSHGTCSINGRKASKCTIPSGGAAELHFADGTPSGADRIHITGRVAIGDPGGRHAATLVAVNQTFSVESDQAVCRIEHAGATGNIVVNSDNDGDIATCGPLYRTPLGRGDRHNAGYPCR